MQSYRTEQIRNVVLISHGGAGKTSLAEVLLLHSGAISRLGRVEDGTTTSDFDPDEIKRAISISTSLLPCEWNGTKINLLDTPGYADFVGEVKAGIRAADAALVVICAASGVEVGTELGWRYLDEADLSRLIFINKMDRENANFFSTLGQIQERFGQKCVPMHLPVGSQAEFRGMVDLLTMKAWSGKPAKEVPMPEDLQGLAQEYREKLVEAIAETDDDLIAKYLEGEELTEGELRHSLRVATLAGKIVPVLLGSALQDINVSPLLDALSSYAPSPRENGRVRASNAQGQEEQLVNPDPQGPLAALVFKTTADPYVGKLSYFRVYAGTLQSDSQVWNASKGKAERVGQLFLVRGKNQEPVPQVVAGDLGAVAKLSDTGTGDSLTQREQPVVLAPIQFPQPFFASAVYPKTKGDLDKLMISLHRLVEEDPTLQVRRETDTAETVLAGMGESHIDVAIERMRRKFGVEVTTEVPKVPYKETIAVSTKAEYRHKKQTGGHGQYGHVFLELDPLPRGAGFEFADRVVGGAVPKNYISAVEKGVLSALQEGGLAGFPVVDVKAILYDGSYHPVDSSDMSFQIAGSMAFRKGLSQGQPVILEPIMNLQVRVPEYAMGDTIGDLNGKRAHVLGMTQDDGFSIIEAQIPLAEIQRYATTLRSITQGRGTFTTEFSHYEEVPQHVAQRIIEQSKKEAEHA